MSDFVELARKRRSIRRYSGEKIDREIINNILKTALLAPSSWGRHPVEFVMVDDKKMLRDIARCKRMGAGPLQNADVAVVVIVDRKDCELWIEDGAVASTYLLLAAEACGIGACWIHMRGREGQVLSAEEEIQQLLGIPSRYGVLNVVAFGHKGEKKPAHTEKDLPYRNIHQGVF